MKDTQVKLLLTSLTCKANNLKVSIQLSVAATMIV